MPSFNLSPTSKPFSLVLPTNRLKIDILQFDCLSLELKKKTKYAETSITIILIIYVFEPMNDNFSSTLYRNPAQSTKE